jgi:hypothetical protein
VNITSNLKFSHHCIKVEKTCNKLLGYIKRQFNYRNREIILNLYKSIILPHLEYGVSLWNSNLDKDIQRLEKVQARATKLIPEIRNKTYADRLKILGLMTLKNRRTRIDLIQAYKIINKIDNVEIGDYNLELNNESITRSNGFKLKVKGYKTMALGNSFSYRIINDWNNLPSEIVSSNTLAIFKSKLDKHIISTLSD